MINLLLAKEGLICRHLCVIGSPMVPFLNLAQPFDISYYLQPFDITLFLI